MVNSRGHLFDETLRHLAEGPALSDGNPPRLPLGHLCVEGVNSLMPQLPVLCGLRARLRERDIGVGPKPHVAPLAVELETEHPGPGAGGGDAEMKATVV